MKKHYYPELNRGYTIIETMIAISLFLVVITFGMNSLLGANLVHQKTRDLREEMDNLSFILEDMSRNLRTGSNIHCITAGDTLPATEMSSPKSCASGWGIAFEAVEGTKTDHDDQWVYYIAGNKIFKSTKGPANLTNFVQLTPNDVTIGSISGFSVLGGEAPPGNLQRPLVTIRLAGEIISKGVSTPFSIETSVSQRLVDI